MKPRLVEIYDSLPWSERTLLKRIQGKVYPFELRNDTGGACDYRVIDAGVDLGLVLYRGGRKLCCHGLIRTEEERTA